MKYSEVYRTTGGQCLLSKNGGYVASVTQHQLIVRNSISGEIFKTFVCDDVIEKIDWSPDSEFISCLVYKGCKIQIFSLKAPDWRCKITEGSAGIVDVTWCPDSRHILTTAEFHVCMSVWSLVDCTVSYIHNLKRCTKPVAFSPDGSILAVAEVHDSKEKISLLNTLTWKMIKQISCDDVGGLSWSPNSVTLCVWNDRPQCCSIRLLSTESCSWVTQYQHDCLGVRTVTWSPSGQLLALGCWDGTVLLLNYVTWKPFVEFKHESIISSPECVVYRQCVDTGPNMELKSHIEELEYRPVTITTLRWDEDGDSCMNRGVGLLEFSPCGQWLCSRDESMPAVAWIWSLDGILAAALVHSDCITDMKWDPIKPRLLTAAGTSVIAFLKPGKGVEFSVVPRAGALGDLSIDSILCDPFGRYAILVSRSRFVLLNLSK